MKTIVNQKLLEQMLLSRYMDEKMLKMVKQNKGGSFQLGAMGHEMIGTVCAHHLESGKDWSCPYYRDQPFALGIGCDVTELFGVFMGRATKNHGSGRMMPYHYSHKELRILCQSSVVGSQLLHAVGRAWAIKNLGKDEVVYVSFGDGATSQGDFHESLNFASIHKLPVIFVVQNNGLAISVQPHEQSAGGTMIDVARGYEGLEVHDVDGTDQEALSKAMESAVKRGRGQEGPSLIMAHVPRLGSHSNSDDPRKYGLTIDWERDPIKRLEKEMGLSQEEIEEYHKKAKTKVEAAAVEAEKIPFPEEGSGRQRVFAPFEPNESYEDASGEKITFLDAINHAIDEEMSRDPYVVTFGQDIAHGKGGVFGATRGLTEKHGERRCFNTPLAESTIVGVAIGMSLDGIHKPVAEIQFADYLWTGINQLFNEAASIFYRSNGEFEVPIVLRMPCGGYIQGGPYHSQSIEGFIAHCPGIKVVMPSNAADAKALMKTAIRDPNPVVFLEHKALYRQQKFAARAEPSKDYLLPFGQANIVREGADLTIVAWGMMVMVANEIAEKLAFEKISIEVIDLRTLVPLDTETVLTSLKKTGKLLVVQEAPGSGGFGAEVIARLAEAGFPFLDGPLSRVCGFESAVPYSKPLENEVLPQASEIESAIRKLLNY